MTGDLFGTPDVLVRFTPSELHVVTRSLEGDGGHQQLLAHLLARLHGHDYLMMSDRELQNVRRHAAVGGGNGGYQGRFKVFLTAARRSGWVEP